MNTKTIIIIGIALLLVYWFFIRKKPTAPVASTAPTTDATTTPTDPLAGLPTTTVGAGPITIRNPFA